MTDNDRSSSNSSYTLPPLGQNPSTDEEGTTPGSFAKPPAIAPGARGRWTFASPDTPGMPQPSEKTAWDFLPERWESQVLEEQPIVTGEDGHGDDFRELVFQQADGSYRQVTFPTAFVAVTQLEQARLGIVFQEMERVAEREPHLTSAASPRRSGRRPDGHSGQQGAPGLSARSDGDRPGVQDQGQRQHGRVAGLSPAPTKKSKSSTGPSGGGPTRSWTSRPAATSTSAARRSSRTARCPSAPCRSTR